MQVGCSPPGCLPPRDMVTSPFSCGRRRAQALRQKTPQGRSPACPLLRAQTPGPRWLPADSSWGPERQRRPQEQAALPPARSQASLEAGRGIDRPRARYVTAEEQLASFFQAISCAMKWREGGACGDQYPPVCGAGPGGCRPGCELGPVLRSGDAAWRSPRRAQLLLFCSLGSQTRGPGSRADPGLAQTLGTFSLRELEGHREGFRLPPWSQRPHQAGSSPPPQQDDT